MYGRRPVLSALADERVAVEEVLVSRRASHADVVAAASARGVAVRHVAPEKVGRMSGDPRNDQGVVALVSMPSAPVLADAVPRAGPVLVLDGVTNPGNVGMILRTAVAFGVAGVVLPRVGSPEVGPAVMRASAGVAWQAPVLACQTAAEAVAVLRAAGFRVLGLDAAGPSSLWSVEVPDRCAVVLGSETAGLSVDVDEAVSIPMTGGVESLNVAVAAGVVCAELARRRG